VVAAGVDGAVELIGPGRVQFPAPLGARRKRASLSGPCLPAKGVPRNVVRRCSPPGAERAVPRAP
ncbi:hypothetical protein ACWDUG_31500, partial [Streptomyces cellulosae]